MSNQVCDLLNDKKFTKQKDGDGDKSMTKEMDCKRQGFDNDKFKLNRTQWTLYL